SACVLELPQRENAEFEVVFGSPGDLAASGVVVVRVAERLARQLLERMIVDAEVVEILLNQSARLIAELLVEHRAAVAGDAVGATICYVSHEEQRAAKLPRGQSLVISGQESIPRRVAGDDRAQKSRHRALNRVVIDQVIRIAGGRVTSRLFREGVLEQFYVDERFLQRVLLRFEY